MFSFTFSYEVSFAGGQERTYWKRRFLDALVLTCWNFANSSLFVKNKATGNASWRCSYYTNHWYWTAKGVSFCQWVLLYTYLSWGWSALLVSTNKGNAKASASGTSDRSWLHVSFSIWDEINKQHTALGVMRDKKMRERYVRNQIYVFRSWEFHLQDIVVEEGLWLYPEQQQFQLSWLCCGIGSGHDHIEWDLIQ